MTPKQRELLDFIETYIAEHRYAPTYRDMQAHLGLGSTSGVERLLSSLEEQGKIKRSRNRTRGIELNALASVPTLVLRAELARREAEAVA
jgi:repressor LexA